MILCGGVIFAVKSVDISVIMPCYNEEKVIGVVISSLIAELSTSRHSYEIIFCDNGSTDNSVVIAQQFSVYLVNSSAKTVAGVRNDGVMVANGKMFVFLDADIIVEPGWGNIVGDLFQKIVNSSVIIGSHPTFPDTVSPILRSWYRAISNDMRRTHFGTGHMLLSAIIFNAIGGFDNSLVTGEDYDFCVKAKRMGVSIVTDRRLVVCHVGYPDNIIDFAKREMWHGEGDFKSLKCMVKSKVALAAVCFFMLILFSIFTLFISVSYSCLFIMLAWLEAVVVQYYKFGFVSFTSSVSRSFISCIYLFSRALSLPLIIYKKSLSY